MQNFHILSRQATLPAMEHDYMKLYLRKLYCQYVSKNEYIWKGILRWQTTSLLSFRTANKEKEYQWQPSPVFLPGRLAGYSPQGHKNLTRLSNWTTTIFRCGLISFLNLPICFGERRCLTVKIIRTDVFTKPAVCLTLSQREFYWNVIV